MKMANDSSTGEKEKGLGTEIAGIALLALALYVGVSLFTPLAGGQQGGVAGAFISGISFKAVGYASYILPLFLLVIGFKFLLRRALTISVLAPISIAIFMVAGSALITTVGGPGTGGAVGEAITATLEHYAGRAGSLGVLVSLIVLSVLAFSGISKKRRPAGEAGPSAQESPYYIKDDEEKDEEDGYNY